MREQLSGSAAGDATIARRMRGKVRPGRRHRADVVDEDDAAHGAPGRPRALAPDASTKAKCLLGDATTAIATALGDGDVDRLRANERAHRRAFAPKARLLEGRC